MMAPLEGCLDPKYVERNAAIPAIMATVEWAGKSGLLVRMPRMRMPSAPIWLSRVSARLMSAMPIGLNSLVVSHAYGLDNRTIAESIVWSTATVIAAALISLLF